MASHRETEATYRQALALARTVAESHLSAHLAVAGDDRDGALEDLAQSIIGTEGVVRLIMSVPYDRARYEPVLVAAADQVGRAFFPDVHKRFVSSLDNLWQAQFAEATTQSPAPAASDIRSIAKSLPEGLEPYFRKLVRQSGVERLTSRLWDGAGAAELAMRLTRLRRHYPDGRVPFEVVAAPERDMTREEILAVARGVASGLHIAFPWGFFARQSHERIALATRYLVETELRRLPEELLREGTLPFVAHGLGPAIRRCSGSLNRLLALAFPGRVRPWMDSHVPPRYWDVLAHRQEAVRWLVEVHLGLTEQSIADAIHGGRLSKREFAEAGLTWLIKNVYRWSVADALAEAYPSLQPWERARRIPPSAWSGAEGRVLAAMAIGWALDREGIDAEALRTPFAARTLRTALRPWNLVSAFSLGFGDDVASALEAVFPGRFREWEVSRVPRERWHDQALRAAAVQWLLGRLGIEPAAIPRAVAQGRLTPNVFTETGLDGLLRVTGSVWRALDDVFPGSFRRWELSAVPRSYWRSRANVRQAVEWALTRLDVPRGDVVAALKAGRLGASELVRLGLGSLVMGVFEGDLAALLQVADLLPSERRVPLSRYYRQAATPGAGWGVSWRLRADRRLSRGMEMGVETELERRMRTWRSVREERRRRSLPAPL